MLYALKHFYVFAVHSAHGEGSPEEAKSVRRYKDESARPVFLAVLLSSSPPLRFLWSTQPEMESRAK